MFILCQLCWCLQCCVRCQASEEEHVLIYDFEKGTFMKDGPAAVILRDANQVSESICLPLLILDHQAGVSCMEWSPKRRNVLAVGGKHGVCVWNITRGQVVWASRLLQAEQNVLAE